MHISQIILEYLNSVNFLYVLQLKIKLAILIIQTVLMINKIIIHELEINYGDNDYTNILQLPI